MSILRVILSAMPEEPLELSGDYLIDQLEAHDTLSGTAEGIEGLTNIPFHAIDVVAVSGHDVTPVTPSDANCVGGENPCDGLDWSLYPVSEDVKNGDSFETTQERLMLSVWDGDNKVPITAATSSDSHISADIDSYDGSLAIATSSIYDTYTSVIHAETEECSIEFTVTFGYGE